MEQAGCEDKAVRFRVCQIISTTLKSLPEDAEISDEIWAPLLKAMLERAKDKIPRVRASAAAALCRLQSTGDPADDKATECLVRMLSADRSAAVRKAALHAAAISDYTLPSVLKRVKDISEDVRKTALSTLANKVNPVGVPCEILIELLWGGLKDRSSSVRKICAEDLLIRGWFEGACQGNIFNLAELLKPKKNEKEVLLALKVLLSSPKGLRVLDTICIDVNSLTHEDVLVLTAISEVDRGDERLEKFIPSTSAYAEVLKYYSCDEFASRNLLRLTKKIDTSDEVGRKALEDTLRTEFLSSRAVSHSVIPEAVSALRRVMVSQDDCTRTAVDIVLNELIGDEVYQSLPEDQRDEWIEGRAFKISEALLHGARVESSEIGVNPLYRTLIDQLVLPRLLNPDVSRRVSALHCLALFCLLDRSGEQAKAHLPLYVQACKNDVAEVQVLAMKCLVDFVMALELSMPCESHNSESLDDESLEENDPIHAESFKTREVVTKEVVSLLNSYLSDEDEELQSCAAESLAKLLFAQRVSADSALLSRLIVLFHNPESEENPRLRQSLSVFLPAYAFAHPEHRHALGDALLPTSRALLGAPPSTPLSEVNVLKVVQFILYLTDPSNAAQSREGHKHEKIVADIVNSTENVHVRIAEQILNELIDIGGEDIEGCRLYSRLLGSLRLECTSDTIATISLLIKYCNTALDVIEDRRSFSLVKKWRDKLNSAKENHQDASNVEPHSETEELEEQNEAETSNVSDKPVESTGETSGVSETSEILNV
eukprot:Plantae.Rhodophyta-Hildenbrandia_rubra.ctg5996.p1 GENE.Plantae.Rhodophyta-Hildenbrandia_rubra.ctg5996~~Plantae.Rhodophyta-Hildenbrandia_rubra.ctg5996.p1  ORF type:complete len:772 (-),score=133.61 Plantae.Rhodophyta-Hildenbrandia_rubra.ctg5996:1743-4058(-)